MGSNTNNIRPFVGKPLPFDLEPGRRSFNTKCPQCGDERSKNHARSLSVYRDEDGMVRYRCNHSGQCVWNSWQTAADPAPEEVPHVVEAVAVIPIPSHEVIPTDYRGDALYWYRDVEGSYLFANRRIEVSTGKLYVPFIYTLQGFISGKNAKWPRDFKGLYGAETIKGKTKAVVVEGEKAAEAAKKIFPDYAVVSWLGGANRGYDTADWSLLREIDSVLLWPDNDEAGMKVMRTIASKLPNRRIVIAATSHLQPKADLADNLSNEDIATAIKGGHEISTKLQGVWSLDDITKQIVEIHSSRDSGYEILDSHTKLPGSGLLVVEGRTKHGKSALAVALTSTMLEKRLENTVVYYSYEMTASKVFLRYIKSLNPKLTLETYANTPEYDQVAEWINQGHLQIVDQSAQLSIADIVLATNKPQVRGGIVVLDYLQIVPMASNFGRNSRQLMLKEMLDELRVAAHKNNVLVLVLSQLTPDYIDPRNDSPREAKDIHYSADQVLRIWNKAVGENHPTYANLPGDYILHTYLNRDGESNVKYEGSLEAGSKLVLKRRIRDK